MRTTMNFSQDGNKTTINGVEVKVPRNSTVSVVGNNIYVNGELYTNEALKGKEVVKIVINGDVASIKTDLDVECNNVNGNVSCGRDCEVSGDVGGNITAGRDIDCERISGSANAGRDICY